MRWGPPCNVCAKPYAVLKDESSGEWYYRHHCEILMNKNDAANLVRVTTSEDQPAGSFEADAPEGE